MEEMYTSAPNFQEVVQMDQLKYQDVFQLSAYQIEEMSGKPLVPLQSVDISFCGNQCIANKARVTRELTTMGRSGRKPLTTL
jgi:hypothetical protein